MPSDITRLAGGNPFAEYPELRALWPADLSLHAEEGIVELLNQPRNVEAGDVYLIHSDNQLQGITGFYPLVSEPTRKISDIKEVGLVWTGVMTPYRGQGVFKSILPIVARAAATKYPASQHLVELLPATVYGMGIKPIFQALGFLEEPGLIHMDWYHSPWRRMVLDLVRFRS